MSKLSDETLGVLDSFWAADTYCALDDFNTGGVAIVERSESDGSEYVHLFRRGQRVQINCSASLVSTVQNAAGSQPLDAVFSLPFLRQVLSGRIERLVGPAYLGYRDTPLMLEDPGTRLLVPGDAGALEGLRREVTVQDWEYGGLALEQPIAGSFGGRALISAAGYNVWGDRLAHIGVLTRPHARGSGHGRKCVSAIADHAIAHGLIPQYRTLYDNKGAMAIAHALAFEEYGATIYIRVRAT